MKKTLLLVAIAALSINMQAQPPADSTPTYPSGATYTHSSGTATITYTSKSGSGTINETTGIGEVRSQMSDGRGETYTLDGRRAGASAKGIVISQGKKYVSK